MNDIIEKAKKIRLVIFDVDGVLTNGKLVYDASGIASKEFHVHDGQGMKLLQKSGVELGIITACRSPITAQRMQDLGIDHVYLGSYDKLASYYDLKEKLALDDEQVAYLGDDVPDLPVICRVGLGATVANAPQIMKDRAVFTTEKVGGKGAARELCELIMRAQGTYEGIMTTYLEKVTV